jgi:hypothetical protein
MALAEAESLNEALEQLLRTSLVQIGPSSLDDLLGPERPLGEFGARIRACHAFGLIADSELRQLHLIRLIRNDFAHSSVTETPSFDMPSIKKRCLELPPADFPLDGLDLSKPSDRFHGACAFLLFVLIARSLSSRRVTAPPPLTASDLRALEQMSEAAS